MQPPPETPPDPMLKNDTLAGRPADTAEIRQWAERRADEALQVLAAVDRGPAPDRIVERVADLHGAAARLRNAAKNECKRALD